MPCHCELSGTWCNCSAAHPLPLADIRPPLLPMHFILVRLVQPILFNRVVSGSELLDQAFPETRLRGSAAALCNRLNKDDSPGWTGWARWVCQHHCRRFRCLAELYIISSAPRHGYETYEKPWDQGSAPAPFWASYARLASSLLGTLEGSLLLLPLLGLTHPHAWAGNINFQLVEHRRRCP